MVLRKTLGFGGMDMPFEPCRRIATLMSDFQQPWFIAGGWAIDLFVGRESRPHHDIEIAVFRKDQLQLKEYLNGWAFQKVMNHALQPWENEVLELPVHELHARNPESGDRLEILLNESEGDEWRFRRDVTITRPLPSVWSSTQTGIPFLNPEIVLLYKAKRTRDKDHHDFMTVKDRLDRTQREWLWQALKRQAPNHPWLKLL